MTVVVVVMMVPMMTIMMTVSGVEYDGGNGHGAEDDSDGDNADCAGDNTDATHSIILLVREWLSG
jgi:hypothetical protein